MIDRVDRGAGRGDELARVTARGAALARVAGSGPGTPAGLATALASRAARRVLLVGEAPARGSLVALDATAHTGIRVRAMLPSVPFDAINLLGSPASAWSVSLSRYRARQLLEEAFHGREVVLLGRRVARAFAGLTPQLEGLERAEPFTLVPLLVPSPGGRWGQTMLWTVPHPSPRSRWWADPTHGRLGELFFRLVLGRLDWPSERAFRDDPVVGVPEALVPYAPAPSTG